MKFASRCFFIALSSFTMTSHAFVGVDSSGGGYLDNFKMESASEAGAFRISLKSPADGALRAVSKYIKLAGAKAVPVNGGISYQIGSTRMFESSGSPQKVTYYQMAMTLPYSDILSAASRGQVTKLEFRGELARALYESMEKNGAQQDAQFLDKNHQVVGKSFNAENALMCDKRNEGIGGGGISCFIRLSTAVSEKPAPPCDECGG